jgi:hypothetical protein
VVEPSSGAKSSPIVGGLSTERVAVPRPVPDSASGQRRRRRQLGPTAIRLVSDFLLATAALAIVYFLRFGPLDSLIPAKGPQVGAYYTALAFPLAGCLILVFIFAGVYQDRHRSWFVDELFAVWGAVLVVGFSGSSSDEPVQRPAAQLLEVDFWPVAGRGKPLDRLRPVCNQAP